MEAEGDGGRRRGGYLCGGPVPAVADGAAAGRVVSEHGHDGPAGPVLRHGHLPSDPVLRHRLRRPAGNMALPEPVRGCRLHRQLQACVGVAGGESSIYLSLQQHTNIFII